MKVKYGSDGATRLIDDNGSSISTLVKYHSGTAIGMVSHRVKIRHPITDLTIEQIALLCKELLEDKKAVDCSIELDKVMQNGKPKTYLVQCFTVLEKAEDYRP